MASSGGSSGGAPTAPIPIISAAAADSQTACQAGDGTSSPSLSRGEAAGGSGGVLASAWVHIADYAAAGPKERAAWHLRHLLEPLGRGREGEGMSVVHRTVSPQPQQQSGPATSAIGGGRRRRAGSASFSASPPPVLVGLSASNEGGLVGRGGREDVRVLSLAPSTQVGPCVSTCMGCSLFH